MPLYSLYSMRERARRPRISNASPGEKIIPMVGNARLSPSWVETAMSPAIYAQKLSSVRTEAFFDELEKIAYIQGSPADDAFVLRHLLKALLGKHPLPASADSSFQQQQQSMMYGIDDQNYAQQMQDQAANQMMRDSRLQAMVNGDIQHTYR